MLRGHHHLARIPCRHVGRKRFQSTGANYYRLRSIQQIQFGFPHCNNTNNRNTAEDEILNSGGIRRYHCSHPSFYAASTTPEWKESGFSRRRVHQFRDTRRHSSFHTTAIAANDNSTSSHSKIPCLDNSTTTTTTTRVLLPTLGQNGTLFLRSTSNSRIDQVQIISQWRDDTLLEVVPISSSSFSSSMHSKIDAAAAAAATTDTAADADAEGVDDIAIFDNDNSTSSFGRLQLKNYEDGITTSLGRKGAMVKVNILDNSNSKEEGDHNNNNSCNNNEAVKIMVTVPEKFNFDCRLANGDILVDGKVEGDVHLATEDGDITVSKLRGHTVTLDTTTSAGDDAIRDDVDATTDDDATNDNDDDSTDNRVATESMTTTTTTTLASSGIQQKGVIHVRKAIEARTVRIRTPSRVRARMLNGSNVSVHVVSRHTSSESKSTRGGEGFERKKLDDDDEGAIIDVGSLYISNGGGLEEGGVESEARLIVDDDTNLCGSNGNGENSGDGSDDSGTAARSSGLVRVKSTHGHVTVHAKSNHSTPSSSSSEKEPLASSLQSPLIDIGGVNGSCDVTLDISSSFSYNDDTTNNITMDNNNTPPSNTNCNKLTTTRIHFDSMTPESISTITTRGGGRGQHAAATSITVDRKVEAEVRLLSVNTATSSSSSPSSSGTHHLLPLNVDAYSITSDDVEDVKSILMEVNDFVRKHYHGDDDVSGSSSREDPDDVVGVTMADDEKHRSISIETDAYNGEWGWNALDSQCNNSDDNANNNNCPELSRAIEYTQGTMRNRSEEPDSRFDVRSRGGKINIDGAASQALHGFRGKTKEGDPSSSSSSSGTSDDASSTPPLPLLAVATEGEIKLETLSWFGSIARRYGLGEEGGKEENRGIGRQASRKPRLDS